MVHSPRAYPTCGTSYCSTYRMRHGPCGIWLIVGGAGPTAEFTNYTFHSKHSSATTSASDEDDDLRIDG
jgi:hypothetical protein